jgi:outer membrane protein OmpA-like peptidoglycan-associated protein
MRTFSIGLSITFGGGSQNVSSGNANANAELTKALAAANAAADAANAAAAKAQAEVDALRAELTKALKAKEDCEAAKKPMAVRRAEALHLEDIYFELNQSVIRDSEAYKVDNLVKVLKANPEAKVSITGYADQATGTDLRNLVLTKERAEVVAEALKAAGIGPDRIHTEFYGTEKDASFTPENNRLAVCIVNN